MLKDRLMLNNVLDSNMELLIRVFHIDIFKYLYILNLLYIVTLMRISSES